MNTRATTAMLLLAMMLMMAAPVGAQEEIRESANQANQDGKSLIDDVDREATAKKETDSDLVDEEQELQKLYKKFGDYLTNTKWTGNFTMSGQDLSKLTAETYEIVSARKLEEGDYWALKARIKYGTHDQVVPIVVEVLWAGRTPVITVDQLTIPGFGTFDARVVIRRNKYAGTWAHGKVGGHLFGKIEQMESESAKDNGKK